MPLSVSMRQCLFKGEWWAHRCYPLDDWKDKPTISPNKPGFLEDTLRLELISNLEVSLLKQMVVRFIPDFDRTVARTPGTTASPCAWAPTPLGPKAEL